MCVWGGGGLIGLANRYVTDYFCQGLLLGGQLGVLRMSERLSNNFR